MSRKAEPRLKYRDLTSPHRSRRQTFGDLLWAIAPAVSGMIGVAGWIMLGAEMLEWVASGAWNAATFGSLLNRSGVVEAPSSTLMNLMLNIPIGLFLALVAPAVFLTAIDIADWLDGEYTWDCRRGDESRVTPRPHLSRSSE